MTRAELILVPYSLGREGTGMGAGPVALRADAEELLSPRAVGRLSLASPFENEIGACFDLNRQVAAAVETAVGRGSLPVVMTGNATRSRRSWPGSAPTASGWCGSTATRTSHTPHTTASGFFDGTGRGEDPRRNER